jgi:hypothetical protein
MRVDEDRRRSKNLELQTDTANHFHRQVRQDIHIPHAAWCIGDVLYLEALQRKECVDTDTAKGGAASAMIKSFAPDLLRTYNTLNIRLSVDVDVGVLPR